MKSKAKNGNLAKARKDKNDEFYTRYEDVEAEVRNYREHFRGKTVLCNCDDPLKSNFCKYFLLRFRWYGLKRLICTSYGGDKHGTVLNVGDVICSNGVAPTEDDVVETVMKAGVRHLEGNGDFRSPECVSLLDEADIVVTNPPFSLFREFVGLLMEHGKKFLILGSQNNATYKEVFSLFMKNMVWLGYKTGDMSFMVPEDTEPRETRYWQDRSGQKWRSLGNICWFTNLDHRKRHEPLYLSEEYSEKRYTKYDNYDAIEVGRTDDIPKDYFGAMGVPITFLDKYCPEQFEIAGITGGAGVSGLYVEGCEKYDRPYLKGKRMYPRILIRRKGKDESNA